MLVAELKKRIATAMKEKRVVEREILRVALSEIQLAENRAGAALSEEDALKIVRKLMKSNSESIALAPEGELKLKLVEENAILETLLPKRAGVEEIVAALAPVADAIKAAKSDGQATGVAMKHLKAAEMAVDGKDVAAAVGRMRQGP
jgi:uncharacterized protein YqeY